MREGNVFTLSTPVGGGGGYSVRSSWGGWRYRSQVQPGGGVQLDQHEGGVPQPGVPKVPPGQVRTGGTPSGAGGMCSGPRS